MGKGLGIKINIDYSAINELKDHFNALTDKPQNVTVNVDKKPIEDLRSLISDISENSKINLNIDTKNAIQQIQQISAELEKVRQLSNTDINFGGMADAFEGVSKSAKEMADTTVKSKQESRKAIEDKGDSLRELEKIQKEIYSLEAKQVNAGAKEYEVYQKRIDELKTTYNAFSKEKRDTWANSDIGKHVQEIGEFNIKLKEAKQEQNDIKSGMQEYTKLLNEEYKIRQQLDSASGTQAVALEKQLSLVQQQQQEVYKKYDLENRMSEAQKESVTSLTQQHEVQRQITQAKKESKEASEQQKATYRELKKDLNEIHKIQNQIAELEAKKDAGIQTAKEEDILNALKNQLAERERIHNVMRQKAEAEGTLSSEANKSLEAIERTHAATEEVRNSTIQKNIEIEQSKRAYDEVYESLKRVEELNKQLTSAGENEVHVIRQQIDAEIQKQNEIRNSIQAQDGVNEAREREIRNIQEAQREQTELNSEIARAGQMDTYRNLEVFDAINSQKVLSTVKRQFQQVYNEMASLDAGFIDIEKVVDASKIEMDKFKDNVFDFASDVGRSVDKYQVAVERWVTQGFTLAEGAELASESLIGSFIGNVDEAAMVDYMAVPLIAFKDQNLEVQDVLNAMNEVANRNAVEMTDLGEAYKVASQTAGIAGTSFEELTGMVTAAQDATRLGGSRLGRSMRMMDMNIGQISAQLTGEMETRYDFFQGIGLQFSNSKGELRSTYDILGDLSKIWGSLNSEQQTTASFYIAQKEHTPVLQAIVQNWDTVTKATGEAREQVQLFDKEQGSAYEEFDKKRESVEFATARLKNLWSQFMYVISGGREGITGVLDVFSRGLERLIELAGSDTLMNFAKTLLTGTLWLAGTKAVSLYFNTITDWAGKLGRDILGIGTNAKLLISKVAGGGKAMSAATAAGTSSTLGMTKAFGGLLLGVGKVALALWGINEVSKILFDVDLMEGAYNWFKRITGQSSELAQELERTGKIQEEAMDKFYSGDFMSGNVTKMNKDLESLREQFGLTGISEAAKKEMDSYSVVVGDTLSKIANEHGISLDQLIDLNADIDDINLIIPGQEIAISIDGKTKPKVKWEELDPEEFLELQERITTMAEEHLPDEIAKTISVHINSEEDINFTFGRLQDAIRDETAKAVAEAAKSYDEIISSASNRFELGDLHEVFANPDKVVHAKNFWGQDVAIGDTIGDLIDAGLVDANNEITKLGNNLLDSTANGFYSAFWENFTTMNMYDKGWEDRTPVWNFHLKDSLEAFAELEGDAIRLAKSQTEAWKEELEQRNNAIEAATNLRTQILRDFDSIDVGRVADQFDNPEDFINSAFVGGLASVGSHTQQATSHFDTLKKMLKDVEKAGGDLDGVVTQVPHSVLRALTEVIPELRGMPADLTSDAWKEINFDEIGKRVVAQSEQWLDSMAMTFAKAGKMDEWVKFEKDMSDGVTGVLEVMNLLAKETDQTFDELAVQFGVSSEAMQRHGDDIFDTMINYQGVLEDLDQEYITKYKLETDQGTINMDVIDVIHSLPEQVTTKFELLDDGMVNLSNIEGMLNEINDPEMLNILARFGVLIDEDHTGNTSWDLAKLNELFLDNQNSDFVQKFFAEIGVDSDEIDIAERKLFEIDTFLANPILKLDDNEFQTRIDATEAIVKAYDGEEITLKALMDDSGFTYGAIDAETRAKALSEIGIEFTPGMNLANFNESEIAILVALNAISQETAIAAADLDPKEFEKTQIAVMHELGLIDASEAIPDIGANDDPLIETLDEVRDALNKLSETIAEVGIEGNDSGLQTMVSSILNRNWGSITLGVVAKATSGLQNTINGIRNRMPSIEIANRAASMAINPQIGRAFSQSVTDTLSSAMTNTAFSNTRGAGNPRYNNRTERVDSDVWRYWSNELYKGLPLNSSMNDLSRAIQSANDNHKKLIPLYQQQIRLIDQQIKHENTMLKSQQSEMNHILGELRKMGFKTSGNQVTNLGHSKGMRDEKASEANDLLRQYKALYETMESTRQSINALQGDKRGANDSIQSSRDAIEEEKVQKELEKIEERLKRTEGLLTAISNDTNIFSTKLGFLDGQDFELQLGVTEEGINKASHNVKQLTNEFNQLSKMSINYSDNAEGVKAQLESLRSEIMSNADAILAYRKSMNDIQIDRFANDFAEFANTIETNVGRIRNNIDTLRDGLVSGEGLSSSMIGLDFNRRSELEREYEQRLELESHLNSVLDNFAKKNIDRSTKVANAQLTIEQNKYSELLKLANDFTNGKVKGATISSPNAGIGTTSVDTSKDSSYTKWQNELLSIAKEYEKVYSGMVNSYNKAMSEASTSTERELLNHKMIVDQLELQERIYADMINVNNKATQEAREMLKNSDLTTEQRKALESMIREYEQSNIDAQNSIRNSVQERFELEFQLINKAITQAQKYTDELQSMLNIAEAVGVSSEAMSDIHEAIYQSRLNEYATALRMLEDLEREQSNFEPASYEWNLIQKQMDEIQSGLSGLTVDILNANQGILEQQLDSIKKANEKSVLGMGLDEFSKTTENWVDGLEKAYELERLLSDANALEDKTLIKRLELMDRQERVTQNELEYADMLIRAQQLREKLDNIGQERNIQTLTRDGEGNWQWEYVADQSDYDETQSELRELEIEMERFRREQQTSYVRDMNDVMDRASSGDFKSIEDLQKAISGVEAIYSPVLGEDMRLYDIEAIIDAYRGYLENNQAIVDGTEMGTGGSSEEIAKMSQAFADSFLEISEDLGKTIGIEIRKALQEAKVYGSDGNSMMIQNQTLSFPNVTSANGLEEALLGLPNVVNQVVTGK